MKRIPIQKSEKIKSFLATQAALSLQGFFFWGITPKPNMGIL
jgi:hypothetical protein